MKNTLPLLLILLLSSNLFAQEDTSLMPIDKIDYDKVIAYNYNLPYDSSTYNRVDEVIENGRPNSRLIRPGIILNAKQQDYLVKVVNDTNTYYGGYAAACFEPRLTFIFFSKEKVVGHIDVCFECNRLESSIYIPGYSEMFDIGEFGFSESGRIKLLNLCNELNMTFCLKEELEDERK